MMRIIHNKRWLTDNTLHTPEQPMTLNSKRVSRSRQGDRPGRKLSHSLATYSLYAYLNQTRKLIPPRRVTDDDENEIPEVFRSTNGTQ